MNANMDVTNHTSNFFHSNRLTPSFFFQLSFSRSIFIIHAFTPSQHNDLLTNTVKARSFTVKATISVQS